MVQGKVRSLNVFIGISVQYILGPGLALLTTQQLPGRRFFRVIYLLPMMITPVGVVIPIYVLFQRVGLLDIRIALIVTYLAVNLPIVVWLMRDYFQTIPPELLECAAIDGASRYRTFWSIMLPLALPGLVATFLFVLVSAWNKYVLALFLSGADSQTLPLTVAAQNATRGPQWWYMSVLILIMIVPVIGMVIALGRWSAPSKVNNMSRSSYILAHDLGTTGNKASLFDAASGTAVATAFEAYETAYPHPN